MDGHLSRFHLAAAVDNASIPSNLYLDHVAIL